MTLNEVLADVETFALNHGLTHRILMHAETADRATFLLGFPKQGGSRGARDGTRVLALPMRFQIHSPGNIAVRAVLEGGQQLRRID